MSDSSAIKTLARQNYEETFQIAVNQSKMTEAQRSELLDKLDKVASNDLTVTQDIESDIKVSKNDEGNLDIDLIAHCMKTNEDAPDKMEIYYAAGKCGIKSPSIEEREKCEQLLERIVTTVLRGITLPGIDAIKQQLISQGNKKMLACLQ